MTKHVVMTGGTGYIGRHVLEALLADGNAVTVLARRRHGRLAERFHGLGALYGERFRILEGDVTVPDCGLDLSAAVLLLGKADAFVHIAGLTEFDARLADALYRQNVLGTRNAFRLCAALKIPQFHHISTAFIAGNSGRPFSARDCDSGQSFKNPYEKSKLEAEKFLRSVPCDSVIVSVYRPGIVVGGRVLGEDGSAGTVYAYLKALRFVRECFRRDFGGAGRLGSKYGVRYGAGVWHIPMRVEADGRVRANLVHVRDVVSRILRGVRRPPGACSTYHLVSSPAFSLEEIRQAFCARLGMEGVRLARNDEFRHEPPNGLEEKFRRLTSAFRGYLSHMPAIEAGEDAAPVSLDEIAREFLASLDAKEGRSDEKNLGSLALDCLNMERPGKYLDEFSEGKFGESLLRRIPFVEARVRFRIRGDGEGTRTLFFDRGTVRPEPPDGSAQPDFTYELDGAVFRQIVTGVLDPRQAFFKGQLEISGDQELALKFGYIFTEHFANINHRILEELEGRPA